MRLILVVVHMAHGGISADDGMGGVLPEATTMSYHTKTHQGSTYKDKLDIYIYHTYESCFRAKKL